MRDPIGGFEGRCSDVLELHPQVAVLTRVHRVGWDNRQPLNPVESGDLHPVSPDSQGAFSLLNYSSQVRERSLINLPLQQLACCISSEANPTDSLYDADGRVTSGSSLVLHVFSIAITANNKVKQLLHLGTQLERWTHLTPRQ